MAQEEDPIYVNVNIFIKENNAYKKTYKICICPRNETEEKGFHQNAKKILILKNGTYTITKFFCIRCKKIRSSEGGNLSRHYQGLCIQNTYYMTNENIYSLLLLIITSN